MSKSAKLLAITSLALFLVSGILVGIIIEKKVLSPSAVEIQRNSTPSLPQPVTPLTPPIEFKAIFTQQLTRDLSLSPEQADEIMNILAENEDEINNIRSELREKISKLDKKLFEEISKVLDEEQKKKLKTVWRQAHPSGTLPTVPSPPAGLPPQGNFPPKAFPPPIDHQQKRPPMDNNNGKPVEPPGGDFGAPPDRR
ncbi:MAG: hypothetical protein AB1546_06145 [bacterium]